MFKTLLIGFEEESKHFEKVLARNSLPHAILLSGPESIGKRRFARKIASQIYLNVASKKGSSNSDNLTEKLISQVFRGTYPDLYLIDEEEGKSSISVEQIREVIQNFTLKPYYDNGAVIIINDAHKMTMSAANALLKALEEPENDKYFILLTHQEHLIPETINSRTQTFDCLKRTQVEIENIIKLLSPNEEIIIPNRLVDRLNGSLSLLNLTAEINHENLEPKSATGLIEIIKSKILELDGYIKRIDVMISSESKLNLKSQLIQFLRNSEKNTDLVNIKINLFAQSIRDLMLSGTHEHHEDLANTILDLSLAQNEIKVRHLDAEIKLANAIY